MSKYKPILITIDDDYEPEGDTPLEDVINALSFAEIGGDITEEIEYTPAEARELCEKAIRELIMLPSHLVPHGSKGAIRIGLTNKIVNETLDILGRLRKALEGLPVDPVREAAPDLGDALMALLSQVTEDRGEYLEQDIQQGRDALAKAGLLEEYDNDPARDE